MEMFIIVPILGVLLGLLIFDWVKTLISMMAGVIGGFILGGIGYLIMILVFTFGDCPGLDCIEWVLAPLGGGFVGAIIGFCGVFWFLLKREQSKRKRKNDDLIVN